MIPVRRSDDSERLNKGWIVVSLCLIATIMALTVCALALMRGEVPEVIERLAQTVIVSLFALLGRTGTDPRNQDNSSPAQRKRAAKELGEGIVEASQEKAIKTDPVEADAAKESQVEKYVDKDGVPYPKGK